MILRILLAIGLVAPFASCSDDEEPQEVVRAEVDDRADSAKEEMERQKERAKAEEEAARQRAEDAKAEAAAKMAASKADAAQAGSADGSAGASQKSATCKSGDDVRKVAIVDREGGGCGVQYDKFGNSEEVAHAVHVLSYCEEVYTRIQTNLTGAGFTCE